MIERLFTAWGQPSPLVTTSVVLAIVVGIVGQYVRPGRGRRPARRLSAAAGRRAGSRASRVALHRDQHARPRGRGPLHLLPLLMRFFSTAAGRGILVLALGLAVRGGPRRARACASRRRSSRQAAQRNVALAVTRPLVRVSARAAPDDAAARAPGRRSAGRTRIESTRRFTSTCRRRRAAPAPRHAAGRPAQPRRRRRRSRSSRPRIRCGCGSPATRSPRCRDRRSSASAARWTWSVVESRLSTGLARPDLYNWFTRIEEVPHELHPKVAVLSFGADDAHDFMAGVPAGHTVGPSASRSWSAEYRRRVDGVTRELNADGIYVVWLGLPIPDGPGFKKSFPVVNSDPRSGGRRSIRRPRPTSTRGISSTTRTAGTRRICGCTAR